MLNHDPLEYVRGIKQILISDKKRIGFLFGAGSSLAKKSDKTPTVPPIEPMTTEIVNTIGQSNEKYNVAIAEIKAELGEDNFNVETLLSNLEQKFSLIGASTLNGLLREDFLHLIKEVKKNIHRLVSVHIKENEEIIGRDIIHELVHTDFADWIGHAERKYPIEIFTTNYDFLFELGLEGKSHRSESRIYSREGSQG